MQRFGMRRAEWGKQLRFCWRQRGRRCYSGQPQATEAAPEAVSPADHCDVPQIPSFEYSPPPYSGPRVDEIFKKRKEFLNPSMFYFYKKPLNIVHGKMQYLYDENGRRYLDSFGGIATVSCGHCHPDVVQAIVNQTNTLQHSTILYFNHPIADFAEALASKFPGNLKVVFFTNSGTEANELAIMMARLYTGCHDIISLRNAYHGNAAATMGATAQCNWKFNVVQSGVHHAMNPDPYRGVFGSDGKMYAKDVQDLVQFSTSGKVAAFISEAIQGVGGIVELAPGYLPAVYSSIKEAGGICIADEVQAGFGRIGSHFWGFQSQGVVPDIVTMAKGIGNGIPLGAVVTTPEIAEVLTRRSYFNTFGGNPVCTAAGLAVLRVIEKEKLQENAHAVGSYLKERLISLKDKHEIIGDVRGRGLMFSSHRQDSGALSSTNLYELWKKELDWVEQLIRCYVGREALWLHRRFLSYCWIKQIIPHNVQSNSCDILNVEIFMDNELKLCRFCSIMPDNDFEDYQAQATFSAMYIMWLTRQITGSLDMELQKNLEANELKTLLDNVCPEKSFLWDTFNCGHLTE